jgi:AraC-like DNA-binding protein
MSNLLEGCRDAAMVVRLPIGVLPRNRRLLDPGSHPGYVSGTVNEILTTTSVDPRQRLAYWVDSICKVYVQLECDAASDGDFDGEIRNHHLPGLGLSVVRSRAQHVMRTPLEISQAADDWFIVSIQTQGRGIVSQDGRDALLSPGDFAIYDTTRPYVLHFDDTFEQIVLKLRGEQLRESVRDTQALTATRVSGQAGAGHLMIQMICTLRDEIDTLQPASAAAVASSVINILVAGLRSLPACSGVEPTALAAYHLARIKRRIDERLRDPSLSMASVAAELGMSVGHLHRLWKAEPTSPAHYLWNRRLEGCSRELLDPRRAKVSVAEIAFAWGFNDAAHFSRAFRERFGCSPREWRASGGA